ncbi:hypothetical protein [Rosistilla oblonga]|uniref:hypothetical protein n=1 Tax=Rosistilla oblonga TaxID=2527990 RepID=UPI003A985D81
MPVIDYQLWAGPAKQWGTADDDPVLYDVGIHALAKRNLVNEYEVANELIALTLGQALGLPIPSGFPVSIDSHRYFCSMIVAQTGDRLPPGDAKIAVASNEFLCTGTVVFDAWIGNFDRHRRNFHFDEEDNRLYLIDHGNSLFGENGASRLADLKGKIGIYASAHDIAREMKGWQHFDEWEGRIRELPEYQIRNAIEAASDDIDLIEQNACIDFLLSRRTQLRDLFVDAQNDPDVFPKAGSTLFTIEK